MTSSSSMSGAPTSGSNNQILRVNMANIRRKLKENPSEPKYILTPNWASDTGCWRTAEPSIHISTPGG